MNNEIKLPIWKCGCGYNSIVERPFCPKCHDKLLASSTSPFGRILSWTIVHVLPYEETEPYGIAMVGLEHGLNAMVRFDPEDVPEIGTKVQVEIREDSRRWLSALKTKLTE